MTAPPQLFPLVLQPSIAPSRSVTSESSAKSKQESAALLISKSTIDNTVPCPEPCLNAVPTLSNVTSFIVKLPTFELLLGAEPCLLPAEIAASEVFANSTKDNVCRLSVDEPQAAVNASPFHVAPPCPSNNTGAVSFPVALNLLQVPSKDRPFPGAT